MCTHEWSLGQKAFLRQFYPIKGKMWCAKRLGMTETQIRSAAARLGIRKDPNGEHSKKWRAKVLAASKARIGTKHSPEWRANQSAGIRATVADHPRSAGARAAVGVATKARIATQGHPRGMLGKHHSDATKAVMSANGRGRKIVMSEEMRDKLSALSSARMQARLASGENMYSRAKRGRRVVGGTNHFYRSSWEANYARFLEWLRSRGDILGWAFESKTFWFDGIKRGVMSYLPDFQVYLPDGSHEWHEVKGYMDDKSKTKLARMGRYHPSERLLVIGPKQYREISRKLGGIIPEWE